MNKIIPRVCREACKSSDANVKIHALYVLSLISSRLDKNYLIQNILPTLKYITDHDKNPIVSMCVIGNYDVITDILGPDYTAKSVVSQIAPMLMDRTLDRKQFEVASYLLKSVLAKVYEFRSNELGIVNKSGNKVNIFDTSDDKMAGSDIDPFYAAKIMIQDSSSVETPAVSSLPLTQSNQSNFSTPVEVKNPFDDEHLQVSQIKLTKVGKKAATIPVSYETSNQAVVPSISMSQPSISASTPPLVSPQVPISTVPIHFPRANSSYIDPAQATISGMTNLPLPSAHYQSQYSENGVMNSNSNNDLSRMFSGLEVRGTYHSQPNNTEYSQYSVHQPSQHMYPSTSTNQPSTSNNSLNPSSFKNSSMDYLG